MHYEVVDVFTDRPFAGNPLAVVLGADDLPDASLAALAREFNLSETAFPVRPTRAGADYRLRIFTPYGELPFAGHPSVGSAWVLARLGRVGPGRVVQECVAGLLPVSVAPDGGPVVVTAGTPEAGPVVDAAPVLAAVGLPPEATAGLPVRRCSAGLPQLFLSVPDAAVAAARPDPLVLAGLLGRWDADAVSVFAWDAGRRVAHARVFGPDEDAATGSAAAGLGVWLAACGLVPADGETAYVVEQGAEMGRPSRLEGTVVTRGGAAVECRVGGRVVPVASGEIAVPPVG